MCIIRDFTYGTNYDTGITGFIPTWMRNGDPTFSVAHDILEHQINPSITGFEDEMNAIGAFLALRVENGFFLNRPGVTPEGAISFSVSEVLEWALERPWFELPVVKKTRSLGGYFETTEETIEQEVEKALVMMENRTFSRSGDDVVDQKRMAELRTYAPSLASMLRTGYRKTYKRFRDKCMHTIANDIFNKLDKLSNDLIRNDRVWEGCRVRFIADINRCSVNAYVNGKNLRIT